MEIRKITYVGKNYFSVEYPLVTVVQDFYAIKLTTPDHKSIRDINLFLRNMKIDKIQNNDFDDDTYINSIVYQKILSFNFDDLDDLDTLF